MKSFASESEQSQFEQTIVVTDRLLCDAYSTSVNPNSAITMPRIRFPKKRDGKIRVSEQEARFVLTSLLGQSGLLYTVETPTTLLYRFTGVDGRSFNGTSGQSAKMDVTVYTPSMKPMWDLEFKAHGFSEDRNKKLSVQKDIEKLLREPRQAYWFHTLRGVNSTSLGTIWRGFLADVREVAMHLPVGLIVPKPLVFHACVLRQRFSVEQRLVVDPVNWNAGVLLDIPSPAYVVSRKALKSYKGSDGWIIRDYGTN